MMIVTGTKIHQTLRYTVQVNYNAVVVVVVKLFGLTGQRCHMNPRFFLRTSLTPESTQPWAVWMTPWVALPHIKPILYYFQELHSFNLFLLLECFVLFFCLFVRELPYSEIYIYSACFMTSSLICTPLLLQGPSDDKYQHVILRMTVCWFFFFFTRRFHRLPGHDFCLPP